MNALKTTLLLALTWMSAAVSAAPQLAAIFGEGMVLQRGQPLRVWGRAAPGEALTVQLAGREARATAGADGRFQITLPALSAGGPHELVLQGRDGAPQVLRDLWIGDVWLAGGQSNMEWTVEMSAAAEREIAGARWPQIRHRKVARRASLAPEDDLAPAPWQAALPPHVGGFSAVGYFFAREIHKATGVPVGIVTAAWGGTHIETWLPERAALADADLAPLVRAMPRDAATWRAWSAAQQWAIAERWQGPRSALPPAPATASAWADPALDDGAWRTLKVPQPWEEQGLEGFDGQVWYRRELTLTAAQAAGAAELSLGAIDDCDETYVNGQRVGGNCEWDQPRRYALPAGLLKAGRNVIAVRVVDTGGGGGFHGDAARVRLATAAGELPLAGPWRARVEGPLERAEPNANDAPLLAFNGMVHALGGLGLRGVLWYQGESNVPRAARYGAAFRSLVESWRAHFGQPALPVYFVQLASFLPLANNTLAGSPWAELREAQAEVLALPHTGMAVAIDIGDANDIHPRNKQEVGRRLAKLALAGTYGRPVQALGPQPRRVQAVQRRGAELELRFDAPTGLVARGGELRGFTVAAAGGDFHPAKARIVGHSVWLSSPAVAQPAEARYAWVDNAEEANLAGRDGLPAPPFRTDRRPRLTEAARYGR